MINLLPPQQKRELLEEDNWRLTLILGILIFSSFLCLTLILFSIKIYISGQAESQKIFVELKEKEFSQIKSLEDKLKSTNQELSKLELFYETQFRLTEFLERISKILPSGIYLNSFSYRKDTSQVTLSGFAERVESLVDLKNKLEQEKDFKEVRFPSDVWIKLANIDFNVSFQLIHETK